MPADLSDLPPGSVVSVVAGFGYGKSKLAREWQEVMGERFGLFDAHDLAGEARSAAQIVAQGAPTTARPVIAVDRMEFLSGDRGSEFVRELRVALPDEAIVVLLGRQVPDHPELTDGARSVRVRQSDLAVGPEEFGAGRDPRHEKWPVEVGHILRDDCQGWPGAIPIIARQVERQRDVDPALVRHVLVVEAGTVLGDGLRTMDPQRLRIVHELALVAPATTDQLTDCFGDTVLTDLQELVRAPFPMISQRNGAWQIAPLLRDILLARDPQLWERRVPLNLDLAERAAAAGRVVEGMERVKRLNSRSGLTWYVGRWALHTAVQGFPGLASEMMREFGRDEVRQVPDLLLVQAVINVLTPDLPASTYWLDLLEKHHDGGSPTWSSTDPTATELLRETGGSRPVGSASRAAVATAPPWASGLAHVMVATEAIGRGDLESAEGMLAGARAYSQEFPLIGGWRVALLTHVLIESGREERALEHYRRVLPSLEASDFRAQRITFLIDSAMGRCAALEGDDETAERLLSRSLEKTPEFRAGAYSTRMLAYYNNAWSAHLIGKPVIARSAVAAAERLQPKAREATALAGLLLALRHRLVGGVVGPTLTPMQLRVLAHLDSPYSVPTIAEQLVLSPATVRSHIRNLYAALGASSRGAAIDRARQLGLLD